MKPRVPDIRPKLSISDVRLLFDAIRSRKGAIFFETDRYPGWHIKAARRLERKGLVTVSDPQSERFDMPLATRFAFGYLARQAARDLSRLFVGIDYAVPHPAEIKRLRKRASRGWRKHVRRMKAAERRARWR